MKFVKIFFLLLTQIIVAQKSINNLSFQYLTIHDGLSQNTVLAIVQDSSGYIWFGTQDGLNRYDGYSFTQLFNNFSDSNSLSSNEITAIDVAPNGILWIGTKSGLNTLNPATNKIINYFHNLNDSNSIADNYITIITHDNNGNIYIGTREGLSIYQSGIGFKTYNLRENKGLQKNQTITSLVLDPNNNLWVGSEENLFKYNSLKGKLVKKEVEGKAIAVQALMFNSENELWIGSNKGVIKYDIVADKTLKENMVNIKFAPQLKNSLRKIYKDSNGNIWFAEWNGLRILDKDNNSAIYSRTQEKGGLNSNAVNTILEDKSGVVWLGTSFGGVNYFDPTRKKFNTINQTNGLSNDIISTIAEDKDGNLWIGTIGGGLNIIEKGNEKVKVALNINSKLANQLIRIIKIYGNDLWIADWSNNLTYYSFATKRMEIIDISKLGVNLSPNNAIKDIEIDSEQNLWIATSRNGVFKFSNHKFVKNYSTNRKNNLGANKVQELFFDKTGKMWALTDVGLSYYDKKSDSFKLLPSSTDRGNNKIKMISVYVDEENTFWIGTFGSGLFKINIKSKICENYRANRELPNNVVYGILPDQLGNLWLSTNNGIAKFNPNTQKSLNFNIEDGLQSNEFNDNAFFKTSDNHLVFGGINGLNIISPKEIKQNKYVPPIVITNIEFLNTNDEEDNYTNRIVDGKIFLNYEETNINIEFAALNFSQPYKNNYAYMLEPSNKLWIHLGNRRSVTLTNLKHGEYTFRIKGSNNDGVWNEEGIKLSIIVYPPFWLTWWFLSILFLLFSGIIFLIIFLKLRSILKVERLRTKIASDLHDDVGASLTKISMNASLLNYETETDGIKRRVESLNSLSQEVISMMSDIVWSIDARNDTIQDLIDRMKNFAFNHVAESEIDINFISDSSINNHKLKIHIRQNLYLIFKEAFHNAVKYSQSKNINVNITANKTGFTLILVDNGIGLNRQNNLGNGLRNMKMRAERINGKISFINENGLTVSLFVKKV